MIAGAKIMDDDDDILRFGERLARLEPADEWDEPTPANGSHLPSISNIRLDKANTDSVSPLTPTGIAELIREHPRLSDPLIDGLLRTGETANIIAPAKIGKSWLSYSLALSVATGRDWLDYFPCRRGRVLLIDNELHPQTIAHRIPAVAEAMSIRADDYADSLDILSLRGRLLDLFGIWLHCVQHIEPGAYDAVILDAWYRCLPAAKGENDNAAMADAYNRVDHYARHLGAAWLLIHHSTKGSQTDKRVTDVGAGAGSQSRAADTHLILREHEEDGCVTLDAAVRSFAPVAPLPLRWTFPLWRLDASLDPTALKRPQTRGEATQDARDRETSDTILRLLRDSERPLGVAPLRRQSGYSDQRIRRGIRMLLDGGDIAVAETLTHPNGHEYETYCLEAE